MFSKSWILGILGLTLLAGQAGAATISISYNLIPVGGSTYDYVYSIYNDGSLAGSAAVQLFDVDFSTSLYSSISIVTPPSFNTQWSEQLLAPVGPPGTAFDVCAANQGNVNCPTTPGILAGNSLSGFAVQFNWLGTGTPGSQPFQIFNANTSQVLENGNTVAPEPSTFGLLALAVAFGGYRLRRKRS